MSARLESYENRRCLRIVRRQNLESEEAKNSIGGRRHVEDDVRRKGAHLPSETRTQQQLVGLMVHDIGGFAWFAQGDS